MKKKESPLDVPSAQFSALHPALAVLETAMGNQKSFVEEASRFSDHVTRLLQAIDATAWSGKIEAAMNNEDELYRLRILYNEEALNFFSSYLRYSAKRSKIMEGRSVISDAITEALIAHDAIDAKAPDAWLKPIFKARLLVAHGLHRAEVTGGDGLPSPHDLPLKRVKQIAQSLFKQFAELLPAHIRHSRYTKDLVVHGRSVQSHLNNDVDLRRVFGVEFVNGGDSKYPESAKLARLLADTHIAMEKAYEADRALKFEQNGHVNERQHANRMLDFLQRENPTAKNTCGGNLEQQVKAQNERRFEYETFRQVLEIAVRDYRALVEETVDALKASTAETSALLSEIEGAEITTVDRYEALDVMINNCLSADLALRRWVKELSIFESSLSGDLSRGAGQRSLNEQFEELVVKGYAWSVSRRNEKLAEAAAE